jgi:hypothetical protein
MLRPFAAVAPLLALIVAGWSAIPAAQAPAPAEATSALARTVINDLATREFARVVARFDAKMAAALPEDKLAATWTQIVSQVGAFKAVSDVAVDAVGEYRRANATTVFEKGSLLLILVFDSSQKIAGFSAKPAVSVEWTPPSYANPPAFDERELTIGDAFPLPATLSMPKGNGPFPGVVLVHGSGPNDRDETLGANKVFKDLAWGLASQGIAVLRYDKRTLVHPARVSQMTAFTARDEVDEDARLAAAALAATAGVDARRVFVLGHSLGGTLAPRIASGNAGIAGVIIMAGATRSIEDALLDQMRYLKADPQTIAAAEASAQRIRDPGLAPGDVVEFLGGRIPGSYWLDLRAYQPVDVAASLTIPILILQGERDYQVTTVDFNTWSAGLKGRANVTTKLYPTLNHLFIAGAGPSRPEEYIQAGHVDAEVVSDIVAFVKRR